MISIASLSSTGIPEDLEYLEEDDELIELGGSREDLVSSVSPRPSSPFVSTIEEIAAKMALTVTTVHASSLPAFVLLQCQSAVSHIHV